MTGPMLDPVKDYLAKYGSAGPQSSPGADPVAAYHAKYGAPARPAGFAAESTGSAGAGQPLHHVDDLVGTARAFGEQGLGAGFGEEIEAGLRAPFSDRTYPQIRDQIRTDQHAFEKRNPGTAMTAELLGGLAGALVPIGDAARVAGTGAKIARAARVGAITGGVYGLGKAEGDLGEQAKGAALGAVGGGLLGGATQALGSGVGAVTDALRQRLTEAPATRGLRQVATDVARSGTLADHAPGMTLADMLGVPGQRRLDAATLTPSAGGTEALEFLEGRGAGRAQRLQQGAEDALGTTRGNVVADTDARAAARSQAARQNYGAAYRESVPVSVLTDVANIEGPNPFAKAYENGRNFASIDGVALPPWSAILEGLTAPPGTPNALTHVPVQALDYMKRGVDKLVERGGDAEFAIDRTAARAMRNRLNDVLDLARPHAPAFTNARQAFGDASEGIDALAAGQQALREKPQQIANAVQGYADANRPLYRQGVAEDLWSRITGKDVAGTNSLKQFRSPLLQEQLGAAASSPDAAAGLRALVGRERTMAGTEAAALKNSATVRRAMMLRDGEGGEQIPEVASAGLAALLGHVGPALALGARRGYARYAQGTNEQTANAVVQLLLAGRNGPQEVQDVLATINAFNQNQAAPTASRALAGRLAGRVGGYGTSRLLLPDRTP